MKFDFFFTHLDNSLKNVYKNPTNVINFLHKRKKYIIMWQKKWAIVEFLTRLLQEVINKRFS